MDTNNEDTGIEVRVSAPKLSHLDKLYVRAFLSSLSHVEAHKVVAPSLKNHHANNQFSKKEAVQFHISLALQEKLEALSLTPDLIIAKLYKEATREGGGSNHAARVTALTTLGKQLGMFQEKKESLVPIINIISYSDNTSLPSKISDTVEQITNDDLEYTDNTSQIQFKIEDYSKG